MKKHTKVIIGATLIFITSFACSGMSNRSNEAVATMDKQPRHHTSTGFQNDPFVTTAAPKGVLFYLRRFWDSVFLPVVPDGHALPESEALQQLKSVEGDRATWVGHGSFLIRIAGKTILTDPFLTEFASPISWAGPRRFVPPGIPLDKLPPIDIVIISHNHYDHLDDKTIRALANKDKIQVVVPLGLKSFFTERGYINVTELDWNEKITIGDIKLIALPAVHDSTRSTGDQNQTLWASWAIQSPTIKIYFIGDTGYSNTIFRKIGNQAKATLRAFG